MLKLEEISCSRYGSHPAIRLRYSCASSQSIPCQPLLHAHTLLICRGVEADCSLLFPVFSHPFKLKMPGRA